jgi:hypothetical protein
MKKSILERLNEITAELNAGYNIAGSRKDLSHLIHFDRICYSGQYTSDNRIYDLYNKVCRLNNKYPMDLEQEKAFLKQMIKYHKLDTFKGL